MLTPEGYEKKEIKKYLSSIGAFFFSPTMAGYGRSGVPDIVCCIRGRFVGIEVKREGKNPTTLQYRRIDEIRKAGGFAVAGTAQFVCEAIERWIARGCSD